MDQRSRRARRARRPRRLRRRRPSPSSSLAKRVRRTVTSSSKRSLTRRDVSRRRSRCRYGGYRDGTSPSDKLDRGIIVIASVVVVGAIMSILDTTIVNVALATLSRELHASLSTIQWVSTGYLVALAIVIPMTGWASERFGAKRLWMIVVGLFVLGSVLSGLAWSAGSLIFFRVLQGLGGGMIMPAGMTILAQAAGPQRIGRVMSVVGAPMLLGPILGPVLGGLILQNLTLAVDLLRQPADRDRSRSCSRGGCCRAPSRGRGAARRRRPCAAVAGARRDRVRALGDLESRWHLHTSARGRPIARRRGARRRLRLARPARARAAAARPDPVPRVGLRRRGGDRAPGRRRAVRLADPAARSTSSSTAVNRRSPLACCSRPRASAPR